MIGIDITSIKRFKDKGENFANKILSKDEFSEWLKSENKDVFLATRWAIKEAIFKSDNKYFNFNDINIKKINKKYYYELFEISTSREKDCVIAMVLKNGSKIWV